MKQPTLIETYLIPRVFDVPLSEGKTLRAYEIGPPDVPLVVGIHGTPDTGLRHVVDYIASGPIFCRLVTFDRQGYGGSTPEPGRKVVDVVPVVRTILDHLGAESAAVYGHSGGGMLALATAALLPERITKAACVAGNGPNFGCGGFDYTQGPSPLLREEIVEARKGPEASRDFYRRVVDKLSDPEVERQIRPENDLRVAKLMAPLWDKIERQLALPKSPYSEEDAYVDDAQSWVSPWGFELGSITVPTRLFCGLEDLMASPYHSEWMQTQIPNAGLTRFAHFGHNLAALMPHMLAWLVSDTLTTVHENARAAGTTFDEP
ncbi:alpha/beta hydrolase [Mesorhizobium sp. M0898]|uniref:alpha/beta fold hydrolase n=1 Tax=Mesorhizobium sp. M0898 TaxID=2957020 RepID=UPI00333ABEE4